jgi:Flp pilus assembly pilin Flp
VTAIEYGLIAALIAVVIIVERNWWAEIACLSAPVSRAVDKPLA